jgi:hypothetical protein
MAARRVFGAFDEGSLGRRVAVRREGGGSAGRENGRRAVRGRASPAGDLATWAR